jgi:DNA-binding response OmpR family regulator
MRRKRLSTPTVLLVDDNPDLLYFLERLMADAGWTMLTAESVTGARRLIQLYKPHVALLDYMLADGNGVKLGIEILQSLPNAAVMVMTGTILPAEEEALCEEHNFPVLRKPFLASEAMSRIRVQLGEPEGTEATESRALKVLFSYSHKDEKMRDSLDAHLAGLRNMGIIHSWHDRKITAGSPFEESIDAQLEKADLILLLISADFLNSEYCYRKEMKHALERHKAGKARVVPVILRPVDWEKSPFAHLMAVPLDGKPITRWTNRDAGYLNAAREIGRVAEELSATIQSRS